MTDYLTFPSLSCQSSSSERGTEDGRIITCSNRCCAHKTGLLKSTSVVAPFFNSNNHPTSASGCALSITCLECSTTQYICSLCDVQLQKRKYLSQHLKESKKHQQKWKEHSVAINSLPPLYPNQHLDSTAVYLDDDDFLPRNDLVMVEDVAVNIHLEADLDNESICSNVDDEYDDDDDFDVDDDDNNDDDSMFFLNDKIAEAIDRHTAAENIKNMSKVACIGNEIKDEFDLIDLRSVVGKSLGLHSETEFLRIHPVDAARHVLFTSLMESLTEMKRDELLFLMNLNKEVEHLTEDSDKWMQTELSHNKNMLNRINLKGPNSIKRSLNLTDVEHDFGSAYSKVRDSINSMMLRYGPTHTISSVMEQTVGEASVNRVIECRKIQRLTREMESEAIEEGHNPGDIIPVFLAIWDDGFDNTAMKSGIGGLNMGTISCLDLETGNMSRLRAFTDVVSLSRSCEDHDRTVGRLLKELHDLQKPFKVFHKTKGYIHAMVRVINVNRDRVQRNKVSGVLAHNGRCNQRWKYILPPRGEPRQPFYSCSSCFERRKEACTNGTSGDETLNQECSNCCDFNVDKNFSLQTVAIDKNCPSQILVGSPMPPPVVPISSRNRNRASFCINHEILRMAVKAATYNHINNFWSHKQTECYLKEVGVNASLIQRIFDFKKASCNMTEEETIHHLESRNYDHVIPQVWRHDEVCNFQDSIDPLMHMVFEGIVKTMYKEVIPGAVALFGVKDQCLNLIQSQLKSIRRMAVSWIRCETLSNKTLKPTGWRGVDYVAAARLMKNMISHVKEAIITKGGRQMDSNLQKYTIFEQFVCSCQSMVARIMCDSCTEESIVDLENHIKLFLTMSERYCRLVEDKSANKTYISMKGNFLSLLNIPDEMREYGPLRRYWDGDYEAFVKLIKEVLPGGLNREGGSTLVSKMMRFKERTALVFAANTCKDYLQSSRFITEDKKYERNHDIHIYKSLSQVEDILNNHHPLSGILLRDKDDMPCIVIAYKVKFQKRIHDFSDQGHREQRLNCLIVGHNTDDAGKWVAGAWYIPFGVEETKAYKNTDITFSVLKRNKIRNIFLIPKIIICSTNETPYYCVTSDDWQEMGSMSEFELMSIQQETFTPSQQ